jgi:hypothetical protein
MKMVPTKKYFNEAKIKARLGVYRNIILFVRKDMDVNKHARPSNFTYRHKLK